MVAPTSHTKKSALTRKSRLSLAEFQKRALALFPDQISQMILFGSYARGEATPDSDLDVMVVVNWTDPSGKTKYYLPGASDPRWGQLVDAATDVMIEYGSPISVFPISEERFNIELPVAVEARKEGVMLWQKNWKKKTPLTLKPRKRG